MVDSCFSLRSSPDIFFVALDTEYDRIKFMESWLATCGLEYQRVSGVEVSDSLIPGCYDREKRLARFGYDLRPSEIGCFLAHKSCWKSVAQNEKLALILESDIIPSDVEQFPRILAELQSLVNSFDLLRLHGIFERNEIISRTVVECGSGRKIAQPLGDPMGAGAYLITPSAAKHLLSLSECFFEPVDVFLAATWKHRLRLRALKPYPMYAAEFESVIGERQRPTQSVLERLKIEFARLRDDLRRCAYLPWHFFR